jgi:hypothetical protein
VHAPRIIFPLLLLVGLAPAALAQVDTLRADTAGTPVVVAATSDTASGARMTKSPTAAVLFSILPGGGQIYNEQYIKSAAFIGAAGYFAFQAVRYHMLFLDKADEVDALPASDSTGVRLRLRGERELYRDNRDNNVAYYLGVTLLSMIDAYVGAHLFDFDVDNSEDGLSSRLYLDPMRREVGVMLRW